MGIPLWSGQDGPHKRVGGQHRGFTLPALLWLQGDTYVTEDVESLRKTVRDLLAKLQEAEQQHQADRVAFEVRCGLWGEGAPGVGLLGAGTGDFLHLDFMSFWLVPPTGKGWAWRPGPLLPAFPSPECL